MQTAVNNRYRYDFFVIGFSIILVLLFTILKSEPVSQNMARYFLSACVLGSGVISTALACFLFSRKDYHAASKRFFFFLTISLVCALILHFSYHLSYNVLKLGNNNNSFLLLSIINLPWLGYLLFQFLAWTNVVSKSGTNNLSVSFKKFNLYAPIVIVTFTILSIFYYILKLKTWQNQTFIVGFYDVAGAIFQVFGFIVALLCLAISRNKSIFYISLGFLIAMIADIIMNFNIFSKSYGMGSVFESLWFVKEILISYGIIIFIKTKTYKLPPSSWISEINSIRTQVAFWILASSMLVLFITLIAFHAFESKVFF